MLLLQNISYSHPNRQPLFDNLQLNVQAGEKIALTGNNGTGKSTLLRLIARELTPSGGQYHSAVHPYRVPQLFGQFDHLTVAQALRVADKLQALRAILEGDVTTENMTLLDDDWSIDDRCRAALQQWQLQEVDLQQSMATLSGGQQARVFLAGIAIHQPECILLDEPSNHLDQEGRRLLYDFIRSTTTTLIVVSHDRTLMNLLNKVIELDRGQVITYGGNFKFYQEQKSMALDALADDLKESEKSLRKAREKARETMERQNRLNARGKQKQEKAGVARIMMNTYRNAAENSTAKKAGMHQDKISEIRQSLQELREATPDTDGMRLAFRNATGHHGKVLFRAQGINIRRNNNWLWPNDPDLELLSGERVAVTGNNGSGKTTLLKLVRGEWQPDRGEVLRGFKNAMYIDQDYSLLNRTLTVSEQAQLFNDGALEQHELNIRLTRFLFGKDDWHKSCSVLSGGESMRLALCCLTLQQEPPELILLDEPTNNLDLQHITILTEALNSFDGTLLIVSHDQAFLDQLGISRTVNLSVSFRGGSMYRY
ncbi:ABC-F family ATP-binding cassette domain-containing protein [Flavihumibacter petaseus]|uniref:Putative ABC transporter ATP-binding protein n=1 Tax=Flavihumibacter petaseus NBRC 106054 TaxID=1220578 RepID=A0A0E9N3Q7_9BACT|nr:ABC-F family ATP-binding cassette domain-containing protein [Flavihumibacter petaseus]GAO44617.1 putative ABC transporter ATP-binding protein [Flavihumibacter petaseus NBRC 106054]